ncbi:MAG: hypothetical protein ACXWWU_04430 [Candidatus Limnocylindria bacterium]
MKRLFAAMTAALMTAALVPATASGHGFPPIMATGHANPGDIGTCNNTWATDSLDKVYKLTLTKAGTYNLEIRERGPFATIAGSSPGACERGTNNGNLVAAGVTGTTHQEFNATVTVTSAATLNRNPACAGNSGCVLSDDFLDAVFGAGNWARGAWSFTAHYQAGSNGTWFDTSVNWPLNDRGDITGSPGRLHRS